MEVLRWAVTVSFVLLAVQGVRLWRRDRRPATAWLSGMFVVLGAGLLASRVLPEERAGPLVALGAASATLIVAFPYLLFRFAESFRRVGRGWRALVTGVSVSVVAGTAAALWVTGPREAEPVWYPLFVVGVLVFWTGLAGWVVWRLWLAGRHQPDLTRRRVRTMALAAGLLNVALLLAGLGEGQVVAAAAQATALASSAAFVVAFSPPRFLRALLRQSEERALWQAERDLVAAHSRESVVSAVLPHVATLLGGAGALFIDHDGAQTAVGLDESTTGQVRRLVLDAPEGQTGAVLGEGVATVVLPQGRLGVSASPYTPLFGSDELELIERLAALLDLALTRVEESLNTAALTALEQGLIPNINAPPGLVIDTRYRAGVARLRLGGDFMDVVALPNGNAAFVIGDVSGHGPAEAAFAVSLHAGWRTLVNVDPHNPSAWFAMLDETFFGSHPERVCTAMAGRIEVARRTVIVCSAGHPSPVIIGRGAHMTDVTPDPLLGIGYSERRKEHSITLQAQQGLLFYTDGLIEQPRPDDPEQRWREEDLLAWLAARGTIGNIDLDALLWHFGRNSFEDDVAVMLLRFDHDQQHPDRPDSADPDRRG